jgi:hypothetical protein
MEQNHVEKIERETTIVDDILCNKCGKSTKHGNGKFSSFEGCRLKAGFGYGSIKDGDYEHFDLCDQCYVDFTKSFVLPPTTDNIDRLAYIFGQRG